MKKIIICIFLMMLLITTSALHGFGKNIELSKEEQKNELIFKNQYVNEFNVNTLEWNVGDQWTYTMQPIIIDAEGENFDINANLDINDITLEVVNVLSDSYEVDFVAEINGDFNVNIRDGLIELSGEFLNTLFTKSRLEGTIFFRKSDIAFISFDIKVDFTLKMKLNNVLPVRAPAEIILTIDFDKPAKFLELPMTVGKVWARDENIVTFDGQISSRWLRFMNFANTLLNFLPPDIANLLPVIDISDLIEFAGADNTFELDAGFEAFKCLSREDLTVEAGTFSAYKITIEESIGSFYYSPDVGIVIKAVDLDFSNYIPFLGAFNFELSDTNYS